MNSRSGRVKPGGIKAETGGCQYTAEDTDDTGRMTRTETKLAEEVLDPDTGERVDMAPDLPDRALRADRAQAALTQAVPWICTDPGRGTSTGSMKY